MELTLQCRKITVDSAYLLMASTIATFMQSHVCKGDCCDGGDFESTKEVEFLFADSIPSKKPVSTVVSSNIIPVSNPSGSFASAIWRSYNPMKNFNRHYLAMCFHESVMVNGWDDLACYAEWHVFLMGNEL